MSKHRGVEPFTQTRAIITEGTEDAAFLRALLASRNLDFDVRANVDLGTVGGNSGFRRAIEAVEVVTGFNQVSDVVLIGDNDENATGSFHEITGQIDDARVSGALSRGWAIPSRPAQKEPGNPSVSVWMWPRTRRRGCLETLFWKVIEDVHPKWAECALEALDCAGIARPLITTRDKARVRAFISIACKNSLISVTQIWQKEPNLVPLNHNEFNPICRFLDSI